MVYNRINHLGHLYDKVGSVSGWAEENRLKSIGQQRPQVKLRVHAICCVICVKMVWSSFQQQLDRTPSESHKKQLIK